MGREGILQRLDGCRDADLELRQESGGQGHERRCVGGVKGELRDTGYGV